MCVTTMMSPTAASTTASNRAPSKDKSLAPFCYSRTLTEVILLHIRYLHLRLEMASYINYIVLYKLYSTYIKYVLVWKVK